MKPDINHLMLTRTSIESFCGQILQFILKQECWWIVWLLWYIQCLQKFRRKVISVAKIYPRVAHFLSRTRALAVKSRWEDLLWYLYQESNRSLTWSGKPVLCSPGGRYSQIVTPPGGTSPGTSQPVSANTSANSLHRSHGLTPGPCRPLTWPM